MHKKLFVLVLPFFLIFSCKKNDNSVPDANLSIIQSQVWTDQYYSGFYGTINLTGEIHPYLTVKLDANNNYQIIRSLPTVSPYGQLDTLVGTYSYNGSNKEIKFSGPKTKSYKVYRTNGYTEIYFPDWKISKVTADSLKVDFDYGSYLTYPGMEFSKIMVPKK